MMQIAVGSTLLAAAVVCMLRLLLDDEQIFSFIRRFHLRVGTPAPRIAYEQSYDAWELDGEEPLRWGNKAADGATGAADKRQADEPLPPKPKSSPRGGLQPPTLLPHTADDYYAGLREHTTLLSANSDATVLLKPGDGCRERVAVQAYIQTDASPYAGRRISLDKPNFIIGRSGELSDLRFNREGVSRQHAEICSEQKGYSVRDLGSTNGTLLNGEEMAPYQAYPLSDGDLLTVAGTDFRFHTV